MACASSLRGLPLITKEKWFQNVPIGQNTLKGLKKKHFTYIMSIFQVSHQDKIVHIIDHRLHVQWFNSLNKDKGKVIKRSVRMLVSSFHLSILRVTDNRKRRWESSEKDNFLYPTPFWQMEEIKRTKCPTRSILLRGCPRIYCGCQSNQDTEGPC